jgi:DNA-binding NarL/FixJ family response regulator
VALIEDAHWADDASIELLRFLVQTLGDARVLFVVTLRADEASNHPALANLRSTVARVRATAIQLHGLRRHEIKNLVQELLRVRKLHLAPEVISQIEVLCDGNPLFAEELARIALESGGLALERNVPLSVQAMLSERLAAFSERERAVLIRAAIVGSTFEAPFVASIAQCPLDEVLAIAQRAVERGIIVESPQSAHAFTFRHALIREALADQLVLALAAPLHVRIAAEIEAGANAEARASELAYHYSAARVAEKARRYNELAAQAAWDVYAYRDAIRFYSAALRWDFPAGPARAALYERLGTLLYIDGCGEEPARWFERSREEYAGLGNVIGTSHALLLLADQWWVDARTGESLRAASEAAVTLERLGQTQLAAQATLSIARFAVTLGTATQAQAHLRAAARLRAHFDTGLRASFHEVRAETRAALGDTAGSLADCRYAARLAAQTGVSELIAQVENNVALVACDLGELDLAIAHHHRSLDEAHRTGMMWRVAYSALNFANTLMLTGDLRQARALVWEALDCGVTTATFKTKAATVGIPLALALNDRRLLDACADEDALHFAERSREIQRIGSVGAAFAELRAAQGALHEARAVLARTLRSIPHGHRCWNLWLQSGQFGTPDDVAYARTILAGSTGRPRMLRAHALLLAALAARSIDPQRTVRFARVARAQFEILGWRWHAAFCAELSGEREAAELAYAQMGAVRDVERLRTIEEPKKARSELTARQMQIAELVAQGETNRAIAQRLHISEHTVEHHLSGIFTRLGVKSRAQLSTYVAGAYSGNPG